MAAAPWCGQRTGGQRRHCAAPGCLIQLSGCFHTVPVLLAALGFVSIRNPGLDARSCMWIRNGGGRGGGCAQVSQGFVRRANISGNTFRAATGTIDSLAKGIATILPVGISVWGAAVDRFAKPGTKRAASGLRTQDPYLGRCGV